MVSKKQKVFYDTEFLEEGHVVDLISIGMVREDGQELYMVSREFDTLRVARNRWLMENVMSSIDHQLVTSHITGTGQPIPDLVLTDSDATSRHNMRQRIISFTSDIWPEFWAWYGAYDHVALAQLFGPMIHLPNKFPMFTHDLKHLHKAAGSPELPEQPPGKHNALEDARHNVVKYKFLERLQHAVGV